MTVINKESKPTGKSNPNGSPIRVILTAEVVKMAPKIEARIQGLEDAQSTRRVVPLRFMILNL